MKIEKNVPMPSLGRPRSKKGNLITSMEVGDSLLVPASGVPTTNDIARLRQMAAKYSKKLDRTYAVRTLPNGVRIWRVA